MYIILSVIIGIIISFFCGAYVNDKKYKNLKTNFDENVKNEVEKTIKDNYIPKPKEVPITEEKKLPKYTIYDWVYFLDGNTIYHAKIRKVEYERKYSGDITIKYQVYSDRDCNPKIEKFESNGYSFRTLSENDIYDDKESVKQAFLQKVDNLG